MLVKISRIVKAICFCMVAVLMICGLNTLLKPKWLENRWQSSKTNLSFYEIEKDSTEVMFYGPSTLAASVNPYQLYEDFGISSYNLGVMSQPMMGTFFWFKNSLNTQHNIKVAFVEINSIAKTEEKDEAKARKSYDYMSEGKTKLQYAYEYAKTHEDADLMEYVFPLAKYHDRWSELSYDDFDFALGNNDSYTRGFCTLTTYFKNMDTYDPAVEAEGGYDGFKIKSDKKKSANKFYLKYLKRIVKLAEENNIKLVFFKTPDASWSYKRYNLAKGLADKYGVPYIDFNLKSLREKIGFDYSEDACDSVHSNLYGSRKVTKYIGEYLKKHYQLTDYRQTNDAIHKEFEDGLDEYKQNISDAELALKTSLDDYLKAVKKNSNMSVIVAGGAKYSKVLFTDKQKELLEDFGYDVEVTKKEEKGFGYTSVSVKDGNETTFRVKSNDEENSASDYVGGTFMDGMDYAVNVSYKNMSLRLNNAEVATVEPTCLNIIVYDTKLGRIADCMHLEAVNGQLQIVRED